MSLRHLENKAKVTNKFNVFSEPWDSWTNDNILFWMNKGMNQGCQQWARNFVRIAVVWIWSPPTLSEKTHDEYNKITGIPGHFWYTPPTFKNLEKALMIITYVHSVSTLAVRKPFTILVRRNVHWMSWGHFASWWVCLIFHDWQRREWRGVQLKKVTKTT